jgi:hypothetical protein
LGKSFSALGTCRGGKKGGMKSVKHDIFNMHREERKILLPECSAFFECIMPAACDKTRN